MQHGARCALQDEFGVLQGPTMLSSEVGPPRIADEIGMNTLFDAARTPQQPLFSSSDRACQFFFVRLCVSAWT